MNTLYQYILSENVIRAYKSNLQLIREYNEYQHFISRLHLLDKYKIKTAKEVYGSIVDNLQELLNMKSEQAFDIIVSKDSNGYLDKLKEIANLDIKRYTHICWIIDYYNILRRNDQDISKELKQRVYDLLDDETVEFMCKTSKNEDLRKCEGTLCVNGVGYLLYLWGNETKTIVKEAFIDLYRYYLDKVFDKKLTDRNFVYGLTHCIINVSDFYTKNINQQISIFQSTYPIGELYDSSVYIILDSLKDYTKYSSTLNLNSISSDMLAELLVTYKLLLDDYPSNKWYDYGYIINRVFQELANRIDHRYGYIRDHKEKDSALDLKRNEHTNILFILYCRL